MLRKYTAWDDEGILERKLLKEKDAELGAKDRELKEVKKELKEVRREQASARQVGTGTG